MNRLPGRRRAAEAWPAWCLAGAMLGLVAVLVHAHLVRSAGGVRGAESRAIVRVVGTPDLALSSTSRWLRHPSQAEPGAAAQDGPAWLDTDPAGGFITPPRELYIVPAQAPRGGADEARRHRRDAR